MLFKLRERPASAPSGGDQEVDDTTKTDALSAAQKARAALETASRAEQAKADAARRKKREQRAEQARQRERSGWGSCSC